MSGVSIVNFEYILHSILMLLILFFLNYDLFMDGVQLPQG